MPDHSVVARFRKEPTEKNVYEALLAEINKQLKEVGILVKGGVIADASITSSPGKLQGNKVYGLVERGENGKQKVETIIKAGVDQAAG